jgi:L,D-transpeptidase catalytic domain
MGWPSKPDKTFMKLLMKISATLLLLVITLTALGYFFWYKPKFNGSKNSHTFSFKKNTAHSITLQRLKANAAAIKEYAKANNFNTGYCFMADMQLPSGEKRFFIYNLAKDSVELAGLVAHGSGRNSSGSNVLFSNRPNSFCTSLGKYKIGNAYNGKFGVAFKLYGLDTTNSNAFKRFVVLHSHTCVPNEETAPLPVCESLGCPTVAPLFLRELKKYIDQSEKPVLLSIYN